MNIISKILGLLVVIVSILIISANTADAETTNLISNPLLETASIDPSLPLDWYKGGWGTNTRIFSYPVEGLSLAGGSSATKVEITNYTSGDAKWYFKEVPVQPGKTYTYSNWYKSNIPSLSSIRFTKTDGSTAYLDVSLNIPASEGWKNINKTFTTPEGVVFLTVFHVIKQVGFLTTDNFSLTAGSVPPPPPTSGNLIPNPTFEIIDANGDPVGWFRGGYGNNTRTFGFGGCEPSYTYADILYPSNYYSFVHRPACPPDMKYGLTVETADYVDGDAKWYFADVPIGSNKKFKLAYRYRNSTESAQIVARYAFPDDSYQFVQIKKLPIQEGGMGHVFWSYAEDRFTAPQGAVSLTLFFAITNGSARPYPSLQFTSPDLRVDDGSVWGNDLPVPNVSITSPASGGVVKGTVTVNANVTNGANVVAAGLYVNESGIAIGPADTMAPYSFSWDTTSVPDGQYTIKVVVIENLGMGRKTSSETWTVIVNNTLVQNSSFETLDSVTNPIAWTKGGWGNNTRQHSVETIVPQPSGVSCYPTIYRLADGFRVGRVQVDNYLDGDAKWVFKDVIIGNEKIYTLRHVYRQGAYTTELTARYLMNDGSYKYVKLGDLQGRTGGGICSGMDLMQQVSHSFVVPNDAKSMTVYQTLHSNGYIEIDNFDLRSGGIAIQSPVAGSILANTVSMSLGVQGAQDILGVTFQVDGVDVSPEDTTAPYSFAWDSKTVPNGNHNISAKIRQSGNALVNTSLVSVTVSNTATPPLPPAPINLIVNPSLETAGANGNPADWLRGGWGNNTRTFTYTNTGRNGGRSAKVEISNYTNGDAKWYFASVPVTGGSTYTLHNFYRSDVTTSTVARFETPTGYKYQFLGDSAPSAEWNTVGRTFTEPNDATKMTVFHLISSNGFLEVDEFALYKN